MLRKKLLIITFALVGALISSPVLANNCPSASPSGEGCLAGTYYCSGGCRSGLSWCPTWSPSPTCASGLDCSNCSGADSCGVCNACNSGYRLCGAYPDSFCKANGTLPANCASYNTNCDACASCVAGYTLNAGACVPATLKLGSSSVSGTNVVQGGVDSSLFVSGNKVGIGISAPTANLQLNATNNTEGLRIITSNYSPFIIRNSTDTADLFRIDQDGNITSLGNMSGSNTYWNFSGSSLFASSTTWNVGIGTTNATDKLTVVGGINSNSIINGLSLCINGDCKTSWGDAGWAFDGNTVGQTKSFGTLDNYSIPFLTNGVERMRLTNTGNLVIGTSTTGVRLHVESTQGAVAFFKSKLNGGSYAGYIGNGQTFSGEEFGLYYADGVYDNRLAVYNLNNSLFLYGGHLSSDASLAINNNTGNVGIGTTNPTQRLEIGGNVLLQAGNILYFRDNTSYINEASGLNIVAGDTRSLNLAGGSGTDLTITSAGNVGIGTTNPGAPFSVVSSNDVDTFTLTNQSLSANIGFVLRLPLSTGSNDGKAFGFYAGNESWTRGLFYSDGAYGIGPGNATRDVFLRRYSANNLMIDSNKAGGAANLLVAGNVGIGTTTPGSYRLSVDGTTRLNGAVTTSLSGSGNRCVYVDASGNLLAKGVDCGTATGGDNMGDHSATQNVKLNSYWLSGDGGNEGVFVDSSGGVGVGTNSITAGLRLSVNGNLSSSGTVSFTGPVFAGGGNRVLTVDNNGVLGATAMTSLPAGTTSYTLRYDGSNWVSNGNIFNNGTNVGVGTLSPQSRLDVAGVVRAGDFTSTSGSLILAGQYSGTQYVNTLGGHYSSAGTVLGYAVRPKNGAAGYVSSADNISWYRAAMNLDGGLHVLTGDSQAVAIGSDVTMSEKFTVLNAGNVGINITNPGAKLEVSGTFRVNGVLNSVVLDRLSGTGNRIVMTDASGSLYATSSAAATGLPTGTTGQTLRSDGTNWLANSTIYNNGTNVGIGITPTTRLDVNGNLAVRGDNIILGSSDENGSQAGLIDGDVYPYVMRFKINTDDSGYSWGWTHRKVSDGTETHAMLLTASGARAALKVDSNITVGPLTGAMGTIPTQTTYVKLGAVNASETSYFNAGNVGIGTTNPGAYKLNVVGSSNLGGNVTATGTVSFTGVVFAGGGNRMITVDNAGVLGAAALPTSLPSGTTSYTLRYDGSNWVSNGNIFNNGTNVGIGTTSPGTYRLSVDGTTRLNGAVTTSLSGSGNRCVYVDASGNLLAKGVDCGTATGGDNMGDHSATQNVKLNSYWLSGDGGNEGVFVNSAGRVGIGNSSPSYPLDVSGIIKTDNRIMIETGNGTLAMFMADEYGISEAGLYSGSGYRVATYNDFDSIYQYADGSIYASSGNIGLGTTNPGTYRLNVSGTSNLGGNLTTTGTVSLTGPVYSGGGNRMITVDNAGVLGAAALPTSLPSGTTSYTLRYDGSNWVSNGNIFNNGTNVGIGTTTPAQKFSVGNTTSDYIQSYGGFIGHPNANIGGTGDAAYFPEGIYSAKMNWLYGGINMNNGSLSGAGSGTFSGNVGIGTTNIATYRLNVIGTSNLGGNVTATGTVAFTGVVFAGGGNRMITVDNAGVLGAAAMPASLPSGTTGHTLRYDGSNWVSNGNIYNNGTNIGIGTTSPGAKLHVVGNAIISSSLTMGGDVNMGGNNITNLNKLTVNTIDPLYNIQGVNYSTFASSIVGGVKEEYVGTIKVTRAVSGGGEEYEAVVNFDTLAKGSDLWVWRQVVDFSPENVQVNITPYGGFASAYYQIKGNKLIFRSDRPADLSYRLVGKRLDWRQWPTKALDQREEAGFKID